MTRNVKTPISVKVFRSRDFYNTLENEDLHVKHVPPLTFVCSLRLINKIKINEISPFKRGKAERGKMKTMIQCGEPYA